MINEAAIQKVTEAKMGGEHFAEVMKVMGGMLEVTGAAETQMQFDYQHGDIEVEPGDLIPFITIGLRQATIIQASLPGEGEEGEEDK